MTQASFFLLVQDLSVSDREEPSRLDEVGDIMKDLHRSHGGYTPQPSMDKDAMSPTVSSHGTMVGKDAEKYILSCRICY